MQKFNHNTSKTTPFTQLPKRLLKFKSSIIEDLSKILSITNYISKHRYLLRLCIALVPVVALLQMSTTIILERTITKGIVKNDLNTLIFFSLGFLVISTLTRVAMTSQSMISIFLVENIIFKMRQKLISHILKLKPAFHESEMSGKLLTRSTSDFDNISHSISHGIFNTIIDFSAISGSLIAMYALNWRLALICTFALPIVIYGVRKISSAMRKQMHLVAKKLAILNSYSQENLHHNLLVKIYQISKFNLLRHNKLNNNWRNSQIKVISYDAALFSFIDGLSVVIIGLILYYSASDTFSNIGITPGVLVAFIQVTHNFFDPLKQLGATITLLQGFFSSIERIQAVLSIDCFIKGDQSISKLPIADNSCFSVRFSNVSFNYDNDLVAKYSGLLETKHPSTVSCSMHSNLKISDNSDDNDNNNDKKNQPTNSIFCSSNTYNPSTKNNYVIKNIDFYLPQKKTFALVGATGAGKSTIVKLLLKLYDGYQGTITIDDINIDNLEPSEYRRYVSMVSQDLTIYEGSIEFNIHLNRKNITTEQAKSMAKLTGADKFICNLDNGYDHQILESGHNLSHGQKQLLSLTRVLCLKPRVLVFDEATSALDPETESDLNRVIWDVLKDTTKIIVAHKLSTIKKCDKIIVIDHGSIVESGSHLELLDKKGFYHQLVQSSSKTIK